MTLVVYFLLLIGSTVAQPSLNNFEVNENRVFEKNPIQVLQSKYLDAEGNSSREQFLKTHNLIHYGTIQLNEKRFLFCNIASQIMLLWHTFRNLAQDLEIK